MKIITGMAVLTTAEGNRISYTYSEVDEVSGTIIQSNVKKSFVVLDVETEAIISSLKEKVDTHLNI